MANINQVRVGDNTYDITANPTIVNSSGTTMPQRATLQFMNADVEDDATNNKTIITPQGGGGGTTIVQKPTVSVGTYTYNGTEQGPTITWATGMAEKCVVTNGTKTNAGTYTMTIALKNTSTMVWADMTTADMTYEYTIDKADQTLVLSEDSVTLDPEHLTATVMVTGAETALSATTSDNTVATASLSGGTVTISNVNEKNGSATITLTAESDNNYNSATATVSVTAAFVTFLESWLESADLNPALYADLDAVFADEKAVRKLFTLHASVDFLVDNAEDENIETIINNDYCAKWINLRDYALDTLYANTTIAALMDTADKYFYGEWALMPQVPVMTSNTTPYGEVIVSDEYSSDYSGWKAFDGISSNRWNSAASSFATRYIGYHFINGVKVNKVIIKPYYSGSGLQLKEFKIQASNDNTTWVDLTDEITLDNREYPEGYSVNVMPATQFTYYQIACLDSYAGNLNNVSIIDIQFYAWQPKGNVPVMTSNTAPYGTASAYQVFDKSFSTTASGTDFSYQFTNPVCVHKFTCKNTSGVDITGGTLQGSNDGSTWTNISTPLSNTAFYLYHRVHFASSQTVAEIQFYGRELRVSVPTMTSNTSPYGEAISSNPYADTSLYGGAWKSFSGTNATALSYGGNDNYIQYDFLRPTLIKQITTKELGNAQSVTSNALIKDIDFYISNDGQTWTKVGSGTTGSLVNGKKYNIDVLTPVAGRYFRIVRTDGYNYDNYTEFGAYLNFYGLDYSEYDWDEDNPRHYIYDHGVELEALDTNIPIDTLYNSGMIEAKKEPNRIIADIVGVGGTYKASHINTSNTINLSTYALLFCRFSLDNIAVSIAVGSQKNNCSHINDTNTLAGIFEGLNTNVAIGNVEPQLRSLDIENINTQAYISSAVYKGSGTGNNVNGRVSIEELWLE